MYGCLADIQLFKKSAVQGLNIEKITFNVKFIQIKFLAMHITKQKSYVLLCLR